jgi:hypothetical protein
LQQKLVELSKLLEEIQGTRKRRKATIQKYKEHTDKPKKKHKRTERMDEYEALDDG